MPCLRGRELGQSRSEILVESAQKEITSRPFYSFVPVVKEDEHPRGGSRALNQSCLWPYVRMYARWTQGYNSSRRNTQSMYQVQRAGEALSFRPIVGLNTIELRLPTFPLMQTAVIGSRYLGLERKCAFWTPWTSSGVFLNNPTIVCRHSTLANCPFDQNMGDDIRHHDPTVRSRSRSNSLSLDHA